MDNSESTTQWPIHGLLGLEVRPNRNIYKSEAIKAYRSITKKLRENTKGDTDMTEEEIIKVQRAINLAISIVTHQLQIYTNLGTEGFNKENNNQVDWNELTEATMLIKKFKLLPDKSEQQTFYSNQLHELKDKFKPQDHPTQTSTVSAQAQAKQQNRTKDTVRILDHVNRMADRGEFTFKVQFSDRIANMRENIIYECYPKQLAQYLRIIRMVRPRKFNTLMKERHDIIKQLGKRRESSPGTNQPILAPPAKRTRSASN